MNRYLLGILPVFLVMMLCMARPARAEKIRVLLDCDTANEIDDLYVIVRALVEPGFEVVGLTSAHWRTMPNAPKNTVEPSQRLNEELLRLMDKLDIPHPIGAKDAMKDASTPQDSPAARFIIEKAKETPAGEKLTVITTGTMTNLASAITIEPSIVTKIHCYSMGLSYEKEEWGTKDFNARNDLNAVQCLFKAEGLEWHVMTGTASAALRYKKEKAVDELKGKGGVYDFILDYWLEFDPPWDPGANTDTWIMWDVAAVEAVVHPEFATERKAAIPGEYEMEREVWVYTRIDQHRMEDDFWEALRDYRTQSEKGPPLRGTQNARHGRQDKS